MGTQFQCDVGATPTGGFSIGGDGEIEYNGSPTFYACPASDTMYNIYTTPVEGQDKCVKIGLTASGCYAPSSSYKSSPPETKTVVQTAQQSCPAPVTKTITEVKTEQGPTVTQVQTTEQSCPAPETITKTEQGPTVIVTQPAKETPTKSEKPTTQESAPTQTSTGKTCPTTLSGEYQYPHLIVPVSKSNKAPLMVLLTTARSPPISAPSSTSISQAPTLELAPLSSSSQSNLNSRHHLSHSLVTASSTSLSLAALLPNPPHTQPRAVSKPLPQDLPLWSAPLHAQLDKPSLMRSALLLDRALNTSKITTQARLVCTSPPAKH